MTFFYRLVFLIGLIGISFPTFAQTNRMDSLKQIVWTQSVSDTSQLRTHARLADILLERQIDSALFYLNNALKKAEQLKSIKWHKSI